MNDHYFTQDPQVASDPREVKVKLRGEDYRFYTDRGVFSHREIDLGSRILIEEMDVAQGKSILDLGCGYGPIGIVAARLAPEAQVVLVDVNHRAVELCKKNIIANGVPNAQALVSDGFGNLGDLRFDVILSNPPIRAGKRVVYPLISESLGRLVPGGCLWIVVGKKQGAPSMTRFVEEVFGNCQVVQKKSGYWVLRAVKTS